MVDGLVVEVLGGDDLLDDLLEDLLAELLSGDVLAVLGRDDDGVDALGDDGTLVVLVLDGDLGLGVGAEPRQRAVAAGSGHGSIQLVGKEEGQGEELGGLVGGVAEHDTLITGTELLESLLVVETLGDIRRLLLNGDEQVAGLVVETLGGVIVADVLDGVADDLLVVELGLGGDLAKDHDHTGLGGRLASDLGEGVLSQAGIENGVGNLIGDLVGVALANRLGLRNRSVRLSSYGMSRREQAKRGAQRGKKIATQLRRATRGRDWNTHGEQESSLVVLEAVDTVASRHCEGCMCVCERENPDEVGKTR